ncbi:MAG: zinc-binding dehydrogenase, partial [Gammaproteobacteria bacterium]|nr:zinc-binding dehydrogenase [Gammaproteobacteria bacterium]
IPNSDGAGVIEAVGKDVDESRIGERVWVYQAQYERRFGTAAEFLAIDECRAPRLSDGATFEVGACMGIPAMTAHRCVFADGAVTGQTVLVTGGAGRVGHYAVQWAGQAGATVIASASNNEDRAACVEAGAAHVVNHRDDDFANQVLAATGGALVDRIVDVEFGANLATSIADINEALSADTLQHRIAHTLPLEEIAKGNELIEHGATRGAVVLTIDPEL